MAGQPRRHRHRDRPGRGALPVAIGIETDAATLLIPPALAATCAFMLPVGTPPDAIVFRSRTVTIGEMARGGAVLNVVGIVLISLMTALIGPFALGLEFSPGCRLSA